MIKSIYPRLGKKVFGFTLIEVMIGMTLAAVLWMGLLGLFSNMDHYTHRLSLKQKAVFRLDSEMKRLVLLYEKKNLFAERGIHADNDNGAGRWLYRSKPTGVSCQNDNPNCFLLTQTSATDADLDTFGMGQIVFLNVQDDLDDRNSVWIDRASNTTGSLEWTLTPMTDPCCNKLVMSLSYPYRFNNGVNPLESSMGARETLTLETIVGVTKPTFQVCVPPLPDSGVCSWSTTSETITALSKIRAYFQFKNAAIDTSIDSSAQGGGFTFALVDESVATISCGYTGADLGFGGLNETGVGSVAVEFDYYQDAIKNDPLNNHLGVIFNAGNDHNSPQNPTCDSTNGCLSIAASGAPATHWLEDNELHEARIELHGDGISRYKICPSGQWLLQAWVDCSGCSELDNLNGNYTSEAPKIMYCFDPADSGLDNGSSVRFGFSYADTTPELSNFGIIFGSRGVPRFVDNGDGTITDRSTDLMGLKNAQCWAGVNPLVAPASMYGNWNTAMSRVATLASGSCDLSDGSMVGDWRYLKKDELQLYPNWRVSGMFNTINNNYWSDSEVGPVSAWGWSPSLAVTSWPKTQGKFGWPIKDVVEGRYVDNGDGTITDGTANLTILKNATCFEGIPPAYAYFYENWDNLTFRVNNLADGECGLTDGSSAGEWRLPTKNELSYYENWQETGLFYNIQNNKHWSITQDVDDSLNAWSVDLSIGNPEIKPKTEQKFGWPVRSP